MKKLFVFLLMIFVSLASISHTLNARWVNADEFSENQLRVIAHHIVNSNNGIWRLGEHIVPSHAGDDALDIRSSGGYKSYFRLQHHDVDTYQNILRYVIDNGDVVMGQEASPKKFSILALIPNQKLEEFGAKDDSSIGAWMNKDNYRKVRKVKAVFSVMNMTDDLLGLQDNALMQRMTQINNENEDKPAGDLITLFPIPDSWTK